MHEKKEHPQAKWLRAIADGETLQVLISQRWVNLSYVTALSELQGDGSLNASYCRIKPRTITIGKYEVAEPMREAPSVGVKYFYLNAADSNGVHAYSWDDDDTDHIVLVAGMCWLKREDAELATKAITELLTGKPT